jgi:hypothetical protein
MVRQRRTMPVIYLNECLIGAGLPPPLLGGDVNRLG